MASFADLRPIIVIASFLSLFLFFTSQMASTPAIWNATETQRINADTSFSSATILNWNNTNGTVLNHADGSTITAKLAGKDIKIYSLQKGIFPSIVQIDTFDVWGYGSPINYQTNFEHMTWYNDSAMRNGVSINVFTILGGEIWHGISITLLDTMYTANNSLSFTISNSRLTTTIAFAFNTTAFSIPSGAWNNNALAITFNTSFDEQGSALGAFQLITGLLFWNLPGVPVEIYALISFVIWPPIIYVAAIWILRIIGSIFGGGASG